MISEETFAQEEKRLGKSVHFHDGRWWVKTAPFYYKPVHEFRPIFPKSARPHPIKAFAGYSHQVPDDTLANRKVIYNILDGDNLRRFSLDELKSSKRRAIRKGLRDCSIEYYTLTDDNLEQMRLCNISLAERCEETREPGSFLPASYYTTHIGQWREDMISLFNHKGHQFVGAFVTNKLVAYIDVVKIENTWSFSAIKSITEYLEHRPVDALYFSILTQAREASHCNLCERVLNGGGGNELESLARFKADYMLLPVAVPYYSKTIFPIEKVRRLKSLLKFG